MSAAPPVPGRSRSLSARVAFGGALLLAGRMVIRGIDLLALAVLARLLTPADYGVVALAMVFIGLVEMLSNLRLSIALIRKETITDTEFATAFTLSAIRGLLAGGLIFVAAGPLAAVLGEPRLEIMLQVLAVVPILDGLVNQRFVLFEKRLDFSKDVSRQVVAKIIGVLATIMLALIWQNYWALIVGTVITRAGVLILSYTILPAWPRLGLEGWRDFVAFGGWLAGANAVGQLNYRSDIIIMGAFLPPAVLGQYTVGGRMASAFTTELSLPLIRTVYSGLSSIARERARLRAAYHSAQGTILGWMLPVGVGAALVADELVRVMLGTQWAMAATVVEIVAPVMALNMITGGVQALVMVDGRTHWLFSRSVVALCVRLPAVLLGLWFAGFIGVLWARVFSTLTLITLNLNLASRILEEPMLQPFITCWRTLAACGCMVVTVLALDWWMLDTDTLAQALPVLLLKIGVGAVVYVGSHLAIWLAVGRPQGFENKMIDLGRRFWNSLQQGRLRSNG